MRVIISVFAQKQTNKTNKTQSVLQWWNGEFFTLQVNSIEIKSLTAENNNSNWLDALMA